MFKFNFLYIYLVTILILFSIKNYGQNVGINSTGNSPAASAALDIDFTDKGLLIPRVALTSTSTAAPITAPNNWLIVFNINTAGDVWPGPYYWNGSQWVRILANPNDAWTTKGNAGTNPTDNFLGTTDAQGLSIKTNNLDRIRILSDGSTQHRIGIGTNFPTSYPVSAGNTPTLVHILDAGTTATDFGQFQIGALKASANNKVGEINFHSNVNTSDRRTASIESFITDVTVAPNQSGDLRFFTNNSLTGSLTEKMRIQGNGNIGINTTSPLHLLDIRSSTNKTTTSPEEYLLHIGSLNATGPLGLRFGIRTNATTTSRYAAIEVDDAGTKRALALQPNGGNVGIGTVSPDFKTEIVDGSSELILGLQRSSTTIGHLAGMYFRVHNGTSANYKGAIIFERTSTWGRGSLHFLTNDLADNTNAVLATNTRMTILSSGNVGIGTTSPNSRLDVKGSGNTNATYTFGARNSADTYALVINDASNVRIGSTAATTLSPAQADANNIKLDVAEGFTRVGNFNTGNLSIDHPGTSFNGGVGALAIGMNRYSGRSNVDFWNTTANGQATANLETDRGFDWRKYNNSGNEQLVMGLRGDGLLSLMPNNTTTEGGQISLNNVGNNISGVDANAWNIDNHNNSSEGVFNALRMYYNGLSVPALIIPEHTTGNARVGINMTSAPAATLHVNGIIASNIGYASRSGISGSFSGNVFNIFWTGSVAELYIDATKIGTNINTTSDYRIKHSIKDIESGIDKVMKLRPVTYRYKNIEIFKDNGNAKAGFIAHEVQEVIPSAVNGEKDAVNKKGGIDVQSLDPLPIISILTKAIQEQQALIEAQKKEIEELKNKTKDIDAIKAELYLINKLFEENKPVIITVNK
jgi:hypothetical protein